MSSLSPDHALKPAGDVDYPPRSGNFRVGASQLPAVLDQLVQTWRRARR